MQLDSLRGRSGGGDELGTVDSQANGQAAQLLGRPVAAREQQCEYASRCLRAAKAQPYAARCDARIVTQLTFQRVPSPIRELPAPVRQPGHPNDPVRRRDPAGTPQTDVHKTRRSCGGRKKCRTQAGRERQGRQCGEYQRGTGQTGFEAALGHVKNQRRRAWKEHQPISDRSALRGALDTRTAADQATPAAIRTRVVRPPGRQHIVVANIVRGAHPIPASRGGSASAAAPSRERCRHRANPARGAAAHQPPRPPWAPARSPRGSSRRVS